MKKVELKKEFLEKHLELWKNKVCKRKKWNELVSSYKQKHEELKQRLDEILQIFDEQEIKNIKQKFEDYSKKSKNSDNTFFQSFDNKEHIKEVFAKEYFDKAIENYKGTYFYEKVKDCHGAYLNNLENFDNDIKKSFDKVGNWKQGEESKLKYNSGKSKGAMLQYLIIEYLAKELKESIDKAKIIKFYDLSIKILWTPHSIKNAIGLHYNVNNNNFILQLLEFYKKIKEANNSEWKEFLNGAWKEQGNTFHVFKGNSLLELYSWINLGVKQNDKFISIYNDKTIFTLQKLLDDTREKVSDDEFYKMYSTYIEDYKPYPDNIEDNLLKAIYADQFFQYIHELKIEDMNKNIIYYGAPGTGKTYHVTKQLIDFHNVKESNFKIVQFHPSYGYEDFIEGVKPKGLTEGGNIKFELVNGEFKQFCIDASKKPNEKFYFIVDEINRAELSRTFGELLYCFEYRVEFTDGKIDYEKNKTNLIRTQYSNLIDSLENKKDLSLLVHQEKSYFGIPENIYFIGTMNDIDRSIDSFDMALRRRFTWIKKDCDLEIVSEWLYEQKIAEEVAIKYIKACENLNTYIEKDLNLGTSYQIGHSYFMKLVLDDGSNNIKEEMLFELWDNNIKPLLNEYLRAEYQDSDIEEKLEIAKEKFSLKNKEN